MIAFATAAVAVTAGFALQAMLAPEYAAIADVVIARIASEITLDEHVQTVQDDFNEEGATLQTHIGRRWLRLRAAANSRLQSQMNWAAS